MHAHTAHSRKIDRTRHCFGEIVCNDFAQMGATADIVGTGNRIGKVGIGPVKRHSHVQRTAFYTDQGRTPHHMLQAGDLPAEDLLCSCPCHFQIKQRRNDCFAPIVIAHDEVFVTTQQADGASLPGN